MCVGGRGAGRVECCCVLGGGGQAGWGAVVCWGEGGRQGGVMCVGGGQIRLLLTESSSTHEARKPKLQPACLGTRLFVAVAAYAISRGNHVYGSFRRLRDSLSSRFSMRMSGSQLNTQASSQLDKDSAR